MKNDEADCGSISSLTLFQTIPFFEPFANSSEMRNELEHLDA